MFIDKLFIKNFRNLKNISINFNKNINVFYGDNAQGKTNILEGIYFCATGRSHKTYNDKSVINFDEKEAHLQTIVYNNQVYDKIDVHLKKFSKKGIAVNNLSVKKIGELFGILHVVIFAPEDLQLIKSGPSERRRFIDLELCQMSKIYYYDLKQYYKILKQRNNLLRSIQKNKKLEETLFVWNSQLVDYGKKIIAQRKKFTEELSQIASLIHGNITKNKESLKLIYKPSVNCENFEEKIQKNIEKDIFYGSTGIGPHKDDISFFINDFDARNYASQGQQRTAALSAKLAEIQIIKKEKKTLPVLLLDDVLSELDEKRQLFLLKDINDIQVIITCTGVDDIIKRASESNLFFVENGCVYPKKDYNTN